MQSLETDFSNVGLGKIVINADDFAQSEAIDQAILDLARRKIIHSTSALVLSPRWPQSAKALAELDIQSGLHFPVELHLQVGLHLDLTSTFTHASGYRYSLPALIVQAYAGKLDDRQIAGFIELQYDTFVAGYGQPPDFIDGHQHVHQLPIVRQALFAVLRKKGWGRQPQQWIRICSTNRWRGLKAWVIQQLGAAKTREMAANAGIKTNTDFAGVYNFDPATDLNALWRNWLRPSQSGFRVIMCHVAVPNLPADLEDTIYAARVNEYQWLRSDLLKK